MVLTLRFS